MPDTETFAQGTLMFLGIVAFVNLSKGTLGEWLKTRFFNSAIPASTRPGQKQAKGLLGPNIGGAITGGRFLAAVQKYLGVPYVYGGSSPQGVDCGGLVVLAASDIGISVPRTSESQFAGLPVTTTPGPGDLIFYVSPGGGTPPGHVGVCTDAGCHTMISADHPGVSVREEPTAGFDQIMGYRRIQ